jgi:hypothetical protein
MAVGGNAMSSVETCRAYSERCRKPQEGFFIPNYHLYRTGRFPRRKDETTFAVSKGIPYNHVYLSPFLSIKATRVSIQIGNSEILWKDAQANELLCFRRKSLLVGDQSDRDLK